MLRDEDLKDMGVVKSDKGVFLPNDFCLVSLLNFYQDSQNPLPDDHYNAISDFLLQLELDLGACDGHREEIQHNRALAESLAGGPCVSCGKQAAVVPYLDTFNTTISGMDLSVFGVPAAKCDSCGETYYDPSANRYIDREIARFKEDVREDNYVIKRSPEQVDLLSVKRLVFEPKDWECLMRDELRDAVSCLWSEKEFYALYASSGDCDRFDLENILTFNVGTGAFKNIRAERFVMERSYRGRQASALDSVYPCFQQYRITLPDQLVWKPMKLVARGDSSLRPLKGEVKPAQIWRQLKEGDLQGLHKPDPGQPLGIQINLKVPQPRKISIVTFLKPLLDGTISAFHSHNGEELEEVVARLSVSLKETQEVVRGLLLDETAAVLGKLRLVQPYRSGVYWSPADDRLVHIDIRVEQTDHTELWEYSGELFTVKE